MRYCSDTRIPVEPPEDIVVTLGFQWSRRRYYSDSRVPVEPPYDTVVAPGYQWSNQEIL